MTPHTNELLAAAKEISDFLGADELYCGVPLLLFIRFNHAIHALDLEQSGTTPSCFICLLFGHDWNWNGPIWANGDPFIQCKYCGLRAKLDDESMP